MKIFILTALVLFSVLTSCSSRQISVRTEPNIVPPAGEIIGPRKRLAVADFRMEAVYGKRRLGNVSTDILITELQRTGRFIIVERERLANVLDEQKLSLTGLVDMSTAVTLGQLLGADAIITGSVTKFGVNISSSDMLFGDSKTQTATADVNVRLIDIATGRILLAESGTGKAVKNYSSVLGIGSTGGYDEALEGDALKASIADVVGHIVKSMDKVRWSCRIARKVDKTTVIIDAGQDSRLPVGIILNVIRLGDAVKSPGTGEILGYSEKQVGTIQVTSYFGNNGANCEILKNSGISGGDTCRIVD